jgi:integrase
MGNLTILKVQNAKAGLHGDGQGLYLQCIGDAKSWVLRYTIGGKRRYFGLGSVKDVSLTLARELAAEARELKAQGIDPIEYKRRKESEARAGALRAKTFDEVAAECIAIRVPGWKNRKSKQAWENTLRDYVKPIIGALPVSEVDATHVLQVLEQPVIDRAGKTTSLWLARPETANRVRGRIETILNFAASRSYRQKGANPATWRGHLQFSLTGKKDVHRVEHHAAMPYDDLPAFMARLSEKVSISALALQFLILTATRTSETRFARWSEFDPAKGVWVIPPEKTKTGKKTGRSHRVPLSKAALAILESLPRDPSGYVFARHGKPMSENALLKTLAVMGADCTAHGFRSSLRDWASEQTGFPHRVCEMALAHSVGSATARAYERSDLFQKRAELMDAWSSYCLRDAKNGNVVPMKRKHTASAET